MSMESKEEVTDKQFSGSCAKVVLQGFPYMKYKDSLTDKFPENDIDAKFYL